MLVWTSAAPAERSSELGKIALSADMPSAAIRGQTRAHLAPRNPFISSRSSRSPLQVFGTFHQNPPNRGDGIGGNTVTAELHGPTPAITRGAYLNFDTPEGEQVLVKVASGEKLRGG